MIGMKAATKWQRNEKVFALAVFLATAPSGPG